MKHSFKKKPGSEIELEVELSKDDFSPYFESAMEDAIAGVELKGFRKGAAPRELAEKAIDKKKVFDFAAQEAVKRSLNGICQENKWTIIGQPRLEIKSADDGLKYKGALTIFPEIKLADYKKIAAKNIAEAKINAEPAVVSDADIQKSVDWLRESRAKTKAVSRGAEKGDVIDIDFEVSGEKKRDQFILGRGNFLPGFEDKLTGRKNGDKLEFSITVPDDYWQKELREKKLDFKIQIKNVLERELPEATDEFAKNLGNFENLNDLKEKIKTGLKQERELKEKEKTQMKILEEVIEKSEIDLPRIMIEKTLDYLEQEVKGGQANRGDLEKAAKQRASAQLVIYKIAEEEGLKPAEKEVEDEVSRHRQDKGNLDNQRFYDYIYDVLQTRKVLEFLFK